MLFYKYASYIFKGMILEKKEICIPFSDEFGYDIEIRMSRDIAVKHDGASAFCNNISGTSAYKTVIESGQADMSWTDEKDICIKFFESFGDTFV